MKYFINCNTKTDCKELYKTLYSQHGKNAELMSEINRELGEVLKTLPDTFTAPEPAPVTIAAPVNNEDQEPAPVEPTDQEKTDRIKAAAMFAQKLPGIKAEINGLWVWATGETKANKELLSKYGFKYARKKEAWYFHTMPFFRSKNQLSMDQIREKYGNIEKD